MKPTSLKYLYLIVLIFTQVVSAQDMTEGFSYLEKGDFEKGVTFFEKILKDYPTNKTARLCHARAVGLHNNPAKALSIFETLKEEYKNDLEIELNYAESLLWNKKFEEAKVFYIRLVNQYPDNFVAHLGFANTLSNLKEFSSALTYVNKALKLSPNNPGALVSRKYIKLGFANEKVNAKLYNEAETFYNEILVDFPNDRETLMNKANLYLISKQLKKGKDVYYALATNPKDSIVALNGLSLLAHLGNKNGEALKIANQSLVKSAKIQDKKIIQQTHERHVQALIWNKKYTPAEQKIQKLLTEYPNENWVLALSATLAIYRSDFKQSIADYETILVNDLKSFDGNLGVANAYFASGKTDKAYQAVYKTLDIFKNQNDAMNFLQKLNENYSPFIEEKLTYSFDNGNNKAYASNTQITLPVSLKLAFNAAYLYRKTENEISKVNATTNDFMLGFTYKLKPKTQFAFMGGVTSVSAINQGYSQFLAHTFFKLKPLKLQDLEIGYKREIQNFNAALVDKQIVTNNFYLNNNQGTNFNLGWFTQYYYTTQSDQNARHLLFTSLYYNLLAKPVLKTGLNYQFITFKNQVPNDYFSPKKFNAFEVFVDFLKDEQAAKANSMFYTFSGALGFQFIEDQAKQGTYRIQAKLGYKISNRFLTNLYGTHSNIASATAAGFTYTEIGLRLKWFITSKPTFKTVVE